VALWEGKRKKTQTWWEKGKGEKDHRGKNLKTPHCHCNGETGGVRKSMKKKTENEKKVRETTQRDQ